MIPYGNQLIEEDDIQAVVDVLRSDFLTQGPKVAEFEEAFAAKVGAKYAVAVNSGTAALHACMVALGVRPGDEVIVPPITFTATVNCVLFVGGTPVFADVLPSGHIDPEQIERKITKNTKAVIAVDYAGWPCDYGRILELCDKRGVTLVCDACHALGASWNNRPVGSIGKLNTFSFHPVKHIATGEGGMITTDDAVLAERMRTFRTHGITKDADRFVGLGLAADAGENREESGDNAALQEHGPWYYEMQSLGYNYRIADINCALGLSQLRKLDRFVAQRREIAAAYYRQLSDCPCLGLPVSDLLTNDSNRAAAYHAFHLFPLQIDFDALGKTRSQAMHELRAVGVGTQVHYIPVCLQPFYREKMHVLPGQYPRAERFYASELSLPMYPGMHSGEVAKVTNAVNAILTVDVA